MIDVCLYWEGPLSGLTAELLNKMCSSDWVKPKIYDEKLAGDFIASTCNCRLISAWLKVKHPAMRSDIFRIAYAYYHGGIYVDVGVEFRGVIPELPEDKDVMLIRRWHGAIWNGFIFSKKNNRVCFKIMESVIRNVLDESPKGNENNIWGITGPFNYQLERFDESLKNKVLVVDQCDSSFMQSVNDNLRKNSSGHWFNYQKLNPIFYSEIEIPKEIHQYWNGDLSGDILDRTNSLRQAFPNYKYNLWSKDSAKVFISDNFSDEIYNVFLSAKNPSEESDLFRLLVLWSVGGTYIDVSIIPKFNFLSLCDTNHETHFFKKWHGGVFNGCIISKPKSRILGDIIQQILCNYRNKLVCDAYFKSGAYNYSIVIDGFDDPYLYRIHPWSTFSELFEIDYNLDYRKSYSWKTDNADINVLEMPRVKRGLAFFAHPDDCFIFGFNFIKNNNYVWDMVYLTRDLKDPRIIEMQSFWSRYAISCRSFGEFDNPNDVKNLKTDIDPIKVGKLLEIFFRDYLKILTHGPDGEYGHPHHIVCNEAIRSVFEDFFYVDVKRSGSGFEYFNIRPNIGFLNLHYCAIVQYIDRFNLAYSVSYRRSCKDLILGSGDVVNNFEFFTKLFDKSEYWKLPYQKRVPVTESLEKTFLEITCFLKPDYVIEVGAFEASFAKSVRASLPGVEVYAYEANPYNYDTFRSEVEKAGVYYLNNAVSDKEGRSEFFIPSKVAGKEISSFNRIGSMGNLELEDSDSVKIYVDTITLDGLTDSFDTRNIVVWIDVEGFAATVLAGFVKNIHKCSALYVETESSALWSNQKLRNDVLKIMEFHGFVAVARDAQKAFQANILFLRRDLVDHSTIMDMLKRYAHEATELWHSAVIEFNKI